MQDSNDVPRQTSLAALIGSMAPRLTDGVFVFLTLPWDAPMPDQLTPLMIFGELEGRTLIILRGQAEAASLRGIFPSRMITLDVHSALDAVGFLAVVTSRLAAAGIAVNPISAYHHDHLFVPEAKADDAVAILRALAKEGAQSG